MATFEIDKYFLGQLLFGNDEVEIRFVEDEGSIIAIDVDANPNLGLAASGKYKIEFRTETRIISRKYEPVT